MSVPTGRLLPAAVAALAAAMSGCNPSPLSDGIARPYDCNSCHGSAANSEAARGAPPRGLHGVTATTEVGVGAHQLHLRATAIRQAVPCSECHVVPANVEDPGHVDQPHATVTWGPLASHGTTPSWNRDSATCSAVYCHGATLQGGREPTPVWTYAAEPTFAGTFEEICTTCHGWPPPPPHYALTNCHDCHPATVLPDGNIDIAGGHHIDGKLDVPSGACGGCHSVPPPTGAHLVHFGDASSPPLATYGDLRILAQYYPGGAAYYMFGCGNCHPLDEAKHLDGVVEVELYDPAALSTSFKARNPAAAAYSGQPGLSPGSCSNVYCHSTGQETPGVYTVTPVWNSGTSLGCNGCHDNPPRYPSGGAGTSTANSHLVLADDGYEFGHFAGLPGPWHGSKHGGVTWAPPEDASPITCQTCHYDTVDPSNTGPSGFYYLDTTGDYRLPGGLLDYSCSANACHAGPQGAATGSGRVLPLRHVNGQRDVTFDPRRNLTAIPWLPAAPNTPTRPIWVTDAAPGSFFPQDATWDGTTMSAHLASAVYDPSTKTCTNVACHLQQTQVQWGVAPVGWATCDTCHQYSGIY